MSFFKKLKDNVSGRTSKINVLFGNHAIRISEKLVNIDNILIYHLVYGTSMYALGFLDSIYYEIKKFKYKDGTIELNPFKANMDLLTPDNSITIFRWVVGNYLVHLIAEGHLESIKNHMEISEIKSQFFTIHEFDKDDIQVFDQMLELAKKDQRPSPEIRLYDYIFEKVYKIEIPEDVYFMTLFEKSFIFSFNQLFLPELLEALKT